MQIPAVLQPESSPPRVMPEQDPVSVELRRRIQCRSLLTEYLEHHVMLDEDLVDRSRVSLTFSSKTGKHNYPGGDLSSAKCITCNCSDGEKTATDQITGGDDNLSNHPGASDATAAA
ncbi:hypothetical protein Bca52824_084563 [Brassica carinata]|uniref:Uncharacterized protein n=1 Tax=Brassica carinata TaxID=52824 RepID=A0A8X7PPK3_BRACI|nr:hypothetical protein Bca52824_084563 [Brassica carinata]